LVKNHQTKTLYCLHCSWMIERWVSSWQRLYSFWISILICLVVHTIEIQSFYNPSMHGAHNGCSRGWFANVRPFEVHVRAPLHLEVGSICCVRGTKSSLVIGQKVENHSESFYTKCRDQFGGIDFFIQKKHDVTRPELNELGAPRMRRSFWASWPMSDFNKQ